MTDTLEGAVSEPALPGPVTYTIKVLSGSDDALRTILFRRSAAGESIEINAETDAPNLLAELPRLLEAALSLQRVQRSPLQDAESRLVRRLTEEDRPRRRAHFRLVGMAHRAAPPPLTPTWAAWAVPRG